MAGFSTNLGREPEQKLLSHLGSLNQRSQSSSEKVSGISSKHSTSPSDSPSYQSSTKGVFGGVTNTIVTLVVRYLPTEPVLNRFTVEALRQVLFLFVSVAGPLVVTLVVLGPSSTSSATFSPRWSRH